MNVLFAAENADGQVDGVYMVGFMWNKDVPVPVSADNIYDKMLQTLGTIPISKYDEDLFWYINYSTNSYGLCEVKCVYLLEGPGSTTGYMLYPDSSKFLEGVKIGVY